MPPPRGTASESMVSERLRRAVQARSQPLHTEADLDRLMARLRTSRVVLLGEASHGTHEYYAWRTALTRRLVEQAGFSIVAVEGDWPDCDQIDRFVRHDPRTPQDARQALQVFRRWPTWMWANQDVAELITWMRRWNQGRAEPEQVRFAGLDVYSLWDSLQAVMQYLREHQPAALREGWRAVRCFEPFGEDAQEYARATRLVPHSCERAVVDLLTRLRTAPETRDGDGPEARFVAEQNALVVQNAEAYYRAMVRNDVTSWNVRDRHMAETLDRLLRHRGPDARAIVWAHNTHIGDARFTDMAERGMVNLGQLAREAYGRDQVALVGFGAYRGSVVAGAAWDAPWRVWAVPEARPGSWEQVLHEVHPADQLLIFDGGSDALQAWRDHRAIGVVYRPERERFGNYVPTVLSGRYDAFVYLDGSSALTPLIPAGREAPEELPETFPSGV